MSNLRSDETVPRFTSLACEQLKERSIKGKIVLHKELYKIISTKDTNNLNKLIAIITTMEEGLTTEDDSSEHTTKRPHIQTVVIVLKINKKLWTFEVTRGNTDIVECAWEIKLCKSPVDKTQSTTLVIDHNVMRFNITMHNTTGMTVIQSTKKLEDVVTNIMI